MAVCNSCGTTSQTEPDSEGEALPLTWVTSVENGKERIYCTSCAREHLRAIESKLDSEWW